MRQFCICIHHNSGFCSERMSHFGMISFIFNFWVVVIELHHYRRKKRTNCGHFSQRPTSIHHQMGVIEKKNNFWSKWSESGVGEYGQILFYVLVCPGVEAIKVIYWSIGGGEGRNCRVLRPVFHLSTICRKRFVHLVKCATPPPHLGLRMNYYLGRAKGRFDSLTVSQKCHRLLFALFVWNFLKIICNFPFASKRLFQWR